MSTDEPQGAAPTPFDPPARPAHRTPGDFGEGVLGRATKSIYWYIVLTALLVLTSLPTIALTFLLDASAANVPFFALAAVPLGPALSAGLYTVRARYTDEDLAPARAFWRGYRLNWADVLRLWVPALVVLGITGFTLANGEVAGIGAAYRIVLVLISVVVAAWAMHALAIATFFSFRTRDVARLAVYYLGATKRTTFGVLALLLIAVTGLMFLGEWSLALIGVWVWFWYQNAKPAFSDIYDRFTAAPDA
ncbi:DUF624 domain-containing protein [Xylanimonas allomyrinae]|uniref:DUF624 domain-containing protein n=1 Tax=Xylanimonas allomyrinae TaxID=2509459 RepID=UPI0013A64633|nr:DUF624 domain-containing protein [Xylanimonas allomyrinae]